MSKHGRNRKPSRFMRALLDQLTERGGTTCYWCGCATERVPSGHRGRLNDNHATVDHIIPRCNGGTHDLSNVVLACFRCNNERGDMKSPPNQQIPERMVLTEERLQELIA